MNNTRNYTGAQGLKEKAPLGAHLISVLVAQDKGAS